MLRMRRSNSSLLRIKPAELRDNPQAPRVLLSDLRLFNRSLSADPGDAQAASQAQALGVDGALHLTRSLRLAPQHSMISLELSALHFTDPTQLRYAWKLEGFDRDWIPAPAGQPIATYTNLDPGRYRLLAKAANPDGVWSEPQPLLTLEVQPPYWATWWWRAGAALLLLGGVLLALRWRERALRGRQLQLERKVRDRTAEVVEQGRQLAAGSLQACRRVIHCDDAGDQLAGLIFYGGDSGGGGGGGADYFGHG